MAVFIPGILPDSIWRYGGEGGGGCYRGGAARGLAVTPLT